jgi:hypothetical protein
MFAASYPVNLVNPVQEVAGSDGQDDRMGGVFVDAFTSR